MIKEYFIAYDTSMFSLEKIVNEMISNGWQPHGSVFKDKDRYCQPMVRLD